MYRNIPDELKQLNQWVTFRIVERDGRKTKVPYDPRTGGRAKANAPLTWTMYETAAAAVRSGRYDGIGFEFANGVLGIDLDHCISESGELSETAQDIIATMDSYTEISPSGTGIHILAKGTIPEGGNRKGNIEMYSTGRFFTMTGNTYGNPKPLNERTAQAAQVHRKYIKKPGNPEPQPLPNCGHSSNLGLSARDIIEKASQSSDRFRRLYSGDMTGYNGDHSGADMGLCNLLAWWTNKDSALMDDIFRSSGLMRKKWDERRGAMTYGQRTIAEAIENTVGGYNLTYSTTPEPTPTVGIAQPQGRLTARPKITAQPLDFEPVSMYISTQFDKDVEEFRKTNRKSGFNNWDKLHGGKLYNGLYVLGGLPSLGKTTLALQLANHLAEQGELVIYFSLEQSRFELVSKSFSCYTKKLGSIGIMATDIRNGIPSPSVEAARKHYNTYVAPNIGFICGAMNITPSAITATVENVQNLTGRKPAVFIDYIQIVQPEGQNSSGKEKIDNNIYSLKQLQSDNDLFVFALSSFNRQNYLQPVSYESFKESGGVEYSADCVLGLQLAILSDPSFYTRTTKNQNADPKETSISERRKRVKEAKSEIPRKINLECLKNRGGTLYTANFDYDCRYDYFSESGGGIDYSDNSPML